MKVRMGFVSNSSTSSFLLAGWKITEERFEELKKRIVLEKSPDLDLKSDIYDEWEIIEEEWDDIRWSNDLPFRLIEINGKLYAGIYESDEDGTFMLDVDIEKLYKHLKDIKEKYGFDKNAEIFGGIDYD